MTAEVEVQIAAVEHWAYCNRQAALIHVEGAWTDNAHTTLGTLTHQAVDSGGRRHQPGRTLHHRVPVRSELHGFYGICDAVETTPTGTIEPIEHKSGRKVSRPAELQVTLQAIALEEMIEIPVTTGWIWTRGTRRRHRVTVDDTLLRAEAVLMVEDLRAALIGGTLPKPVHDERCTNCSLIDICLPWLP